MGKIQKIFKTEAGVAVPAVTTDQMREIDRSATEETGPNLFQMMENAGRCLAVLALKKLGHAWRQAEVVVLAGPGGNGGGGICAARHLANRGEDVRVCLSQPDRLREVTAFQRKIFHATNGREAGFEGMNKVRPALILDALIGYSLSGPPHGTTLDLIRWANGTGCPILSLDVPSGLGATWGETPGEAVKPTWTLTLALPKTGLLPEKSGEIYLADIGIPAATYQRLGIPYQPPFDHRFVVPLASQE
ncbi:MAG: NAD(P)H-hydrate epimerase [Nitrospiria bacterium]